MERWAFSEACIPIKDKRARLGVAARYIKSGTVRVPRKGCEQLLTQLLGFGGERHDDAVDALVYLNPSARSEIELRSSASTTSSSPHLGPGHAAYILVSCLRTNARISALFVSSSA
jgi:hypothetical protein